ncbi:MAG: endonuclease domain-containing protein [Oscillospiraceae bacterium]
MRRSRNKSLLQNARELRKNMTVQEKKLWYGFLRDYPIRFRRQEIIGNYIVDFYCVTAGLAVEIDGVQHYEEKAAKYDGERTEYLEENGIEVLRFLNKDINDNFENVCIYIDDFVKRKMDGKNLPY